MDNRIADRRLNDRRHDDRRHELRRENDDRRLNVITLSLMAIVHGGFWMGAGVMIGRILWGPV